MGKLEWRLRVGGLQVGVVREAYAGGWVDRAGRGEQLLGVGERFVGVDKSDACRWVSCKGGYSCICKWVAVGIHSCQTCQAQGVSRRIALVMNGGRIKLPPLHTPIHAIFTVPVRSCTRRCSRGAVHRRLLHARLAPD